MDITKERYRSEIGFEFEFIRDTNINNSTVKKELMRLFKVDISLEKKAHSDFVPVEGHWKMELFLSTCKGHLYSLEPLLCHFTGL